LTYDVGRLGLASPSFADAAQQAMDSICGMNMDGEDCERAAACGWLARLSSDARNGTSGLRMSGAPRTLPLLAASGLPLALVLGLAHKSDDGAPAAGRPGVPFAVLGVRARASCAERTAASAIQLKTDESRGVKQNPTEPDVDRVAQPALLWMSPALAGGGYASEALAFAQGLAPLLKKFTLRQFAEHPSAEVYEGLPSELLSVIMPHFERPNADPWKDVVVCHSPPDAWRPSKFPGWDQLAPCPPRGNSFVIGRTMYETDRVSSRWVERCNGMHSVWVPTAFHLNAFRRAGVAAHKLVIVGEPVDGAFFNPATATPMPLPLLPNAAPSPTPFRFLSVFKWEKRKGWDALLASYFAEFTADEPVELVLKTRPFYSDADFDEQIAAFAEQRGLASKRAPVRVLDGEMSLEDLRSLYKAADAFVLPSRGEGWGRPHVEAMAMALPVIATNWSGPAAYLDESVGYPLEFEVQPVPSDLNLEGHNWAEPNVAHLRMLMRRVYERCDEALERGKAARERMLARYSPQVLAGEVVEAVARSKDQVEAWKKAEQERRAREKEEL
jgi:glycosyltransferase involved in cell wall biosynthesis